MVQGSVPGAKGGWIQIRDAVKKPCPEGAAVTGLVQGRDAEAGESAVMELQVTTLDGKSAGKIDARRR